MNGSAIDLSVQDEISWRQKRFWRVFGLGFLALILFIPFGFALNWRPDVDLALIRVLVPCLFLVWLAGALIFRQKLFVATSRGFGLLAVLVICAVSLLFATEPAWGVRKMAFFLSVFPLYFLAVGFGEQKRNVKKITDFLILSALTAAFLGLLQFASQFIVSSSFLIKLYSVVIGPVFWGKTFSALVVLNPSWFVNVGGVTLTRAFGLFPDPHMLAFFIGLIFPLAAARLLNSKRASRFNFIICGLMLVVLLATFSRGGYLGLFFSIGVIIFYSWRYLSEQKRFLVLVSLTLFLLVLIIFAAPVVNRLISSFLLSEGSSVGRLQIWQQSIRVFLSKPIFGVGLGNYPLAIDPSAVYRSPVTSHNLYLDIAAETGIFGLAVWLLLILGSFYQLVRVIGKSRWARDENANERTYLRIGLVGSLTYFAVHSFFETSVFNPAVLAILMLILALISLSIKNEHLA